MCISEKSTNMGVVVRPLEMSCFSCVATRLWPSHITFSRALLVLRRCSKPSFFVQRFHWRPCLPHCWSPISHPASSGRLLRPSHCIQATCVMTLLSRLIVSSRGRVTEIREGSYIKVTAPQPRLRKRFYFRPSLNSRISAIVLTPLASTLH